MRYPKSAGRDALPPSALTATELNESSELISKTCMDTQVRVKMPWQCGPPRPEIRGLIPTGSHCRWCSVRLARARRVPAMPRVRESTDPSRIRPEQVLCRSCQIKRAVTSHGKGRQARIPQLTRTSTMSGPMRLATWQAVLQQAPTPSW